MKNFNNLNMNSLETQFSSNPSQYNPSLFNLNDEQMEQSFQNFELILEEPEEKQNQINFDEFQDISVHEIFSSESEQNKIKNKRIELNESKVNNNHNKEKDVKKIRLIRKIFEIIKVKKPNKNPSKSDELEKKGKANSFGEEFENQNYSKEKNEFIGKKRDSIIQSSDDLNFWDLFSTRKIRTNFID